MLIHFYILLCKSVSNPGLIVKKEKEKEKRQEKKVRTYSSSRRLKKKRKGKKEKTVKDSYNLQPL